MKILLWLKNTSQPIVFKYVINAYTKGEFYCIYDGENVTKFPIADIFRTVESYYSEPD